MGKLSTDDLELFIEERAATINSATLPVIDGHAQQLSQVFFNLMHNALKFCDKQPVINISSKIENEFYIISVSDDGIGLDQNYKNNIFEIFGEFQTNKTILGQVSALLCAKKNYQS